MRKERKVLLLLLGTLLLWPQEAVLTPWPVAVALLAALVAMLMLRIVLHPVFYLLGITHGCLTRPRPETKLLLIPGGEDVQAHFAAP